MLQDVKAASAAVGVTLEVASLDVIMSATQDRHQSAAGQPPTAPPSPCTLYNQVAQVTRLSALWITSLVIIESSLIHGS